jgi:hypothetical protein
VTSELTGGLVAVAVVVVLGVLMRMGRKDDATTPARPAEDRVSEGAMPAVERDDGEELTPEEEAMLAELSESFSDDEVAAVTSDNYAFVPDRHAVRLVPPDESGEEWKRGSSATDHRGAQALTMSWHAGDLTGARVVRGGADEGPWRLEALGRDGDYIAFSFETEDGARTALEVLESRRIISLRENEDGERMAPQADQFEEARRVFLETEAELNMPDDDEEHRS